MNGEIIIQFFSDLLCHIFGHKKESLKYGAQTFNGQRHYICDRCNECLIEKDIV